MRKWLVNNPFFVLLVPLVIIILCCTNPSDTTNPLRMVRLTSSPVERTHTLRYNAQILKGQTTKSSQTLYLQKDSTRNMPQRGDTLLIYSVSNYVNRWSWQLIGANQTPWWRTSVGWQQQLEQRYMQLGITGRELGTVSALTLGYREDLDPLVKHHFSTAGAMHVLAVSGLHTGILMNVLMALLTLFGWRKPMYEERGKRVALGLIVMACLIAYAYLTGYTPSVVRSVIMSCMLLLAMMTNRQDQMLNAIFAAAFLILIFRPTDLFSVSFQLSFTAVIAIALFGEGWKCIMPDNYVTGMVGMTIAAMIGTMPITLFYYGQISNYFMLTNLIVLPLAWLMMVGGLFTLTIGWITPIGKALAWLLNGITWVMNESVEWIEHLPGSTTNVVLSPVGLVVLLAVNLSILIAWKHVIIK